MSTKLFFSKFMDKIKHFQDQHKGNQFTTQTAPDILKEYYIEGGMFPP